MKQQSLPRSYLTELRGREFKGIAPLSQPKAETFLQQKFLFTTTPHFAKVSHRMDARQVSRVYAHEQWQTRLRIQQEIIEGLLPKVVLPVRGDVSAYYKSLLALNKARLMQGDRVAEQMYQVLNQLRERGELVL